MIFPCIADEQAIIPVGDGVFETAAIPHLARSWVGCREYTFRVAFYSDATGKQIVTPTAGTIAPEMEVISGQWHEPAFGDLEINAADCGEAASYEMPTFTAPASKGRVTMAGVEGAAYFRAHFVRA